MRMIRSRKNDAGSIAGRQEALGLDGAVTAIDLDPFVRAQEMLTGAVGWPVRDVVMSSLLSPTGPTAACHPWLPCRSRSRRTRHRTSLQTVRPCGSS